MSGNKVYFPCKSSDYDKEKFGFGYSPSVNGCPVREGFRLTRPWEKFTIEVRDGILPDFLTTELNLPVCSGRMKQTVEEHCFNAGDVDWLPVNVDDGYATTEYCILHVPRYIFAVIDPEQSDRNRNIFFSPHFRQRAIRNRDIFAAETDTSTVYISETLKTALEKERLSGLGFGSPEAS